MAVKQHEESSIFISNRFIVSPGPENTVLVDDGYKLHGVYYGHQDGLYRLILDKINIFTWLTDELLVTASTSGSVQFWNARTCIHQRTLVQAGGTDVVSITFVRGLLTVVKAGGISQWKFKDNLLTLVH